MNKDNDNSTQRLKSYGRTSSHMTAGGKAKLDKRLEPYIFTPNDIKEHKKNHGEDAKVILEIGIGNGELLAERAKNLQNSCENSTNDTPVTGSSSMFVGVEVYKNGLLTLVNNIEKHNLQNVRVSSQDGREILENLPEKSIDQLVVLYPDPWPKKRHNKRRIINQEFLELADKVIKDDGELFIATDIPDYACWVIHESYTHGVFFPTAISPLEWGTPPSWWHSTKYEKKALQAGRKPFYLTLKRNVDKSNTKCESLDSF